MRRAISVSTSCGIELYPLFYYVRVLGRGAVTVSRIFLTGAAVD
jgi:hypothetical protein